MFLSYFHCISSADSIYNIKAYLCSYSSENERRNVWYSRKQPIVEVQPSINTKKIDSNKCKKKNIDEEKRRKKDILLQDDNLSDNDLLHSSEDVDDNDDDDDMLSLRNNDYKENSGVESKKLFCFSMKFLILDQFSDFFLEAFLVLIPLLILICIQT